jgi:peptide/nickel transport system substrate-binding protein
MFTRQGRIGIWLIILMSVFFGTYILSGISTSIAKEKVLRISQAGEPPTLHPTSKIGQSVPTENIAQLINEKLIDWDWIGGKAIPVLAESYRHVDPLTFEVKLRKKNIKFTNGEPFDANAVKYSLEHFWKEPFFGYYTKEWEAIEIVDQYTVRIQSKKPQPITWSGLMPKLFMYPPKYHQKVGEEYAQRPVGTGPYTLETWDRGSKIVLAANKEYWGEKPIFDKVIWRGIAEDSTRIAALERGEVDLITFVPSTYADRIKANKNLVLRQVPGLRGFGIYFDGRKPPFSDKRVRQALNYAVDKDAIVHHILGGYASKLGGQLLTPAYAGWNPKLKDYPYDPERAKALLKEAGYPNGFEVNLDFPTGRYSQTEDVCQAVMGQLSKVGVKVNLKSFEYGTFVKSLISGNHSPLFYIAFNGDPEGWEHLNYLSKRGSVLPAHIYLNDEYANVLDEVAANLDFEQRKLLIRKAVEIAREDPFMIYLFGGDNLTAHTKKLKNWEPNSRELVYLTGVDLEE